MPGARSLAQADAKGRRDPEPGILMEDTDEGRRDFAP
jgi:hypothetical protein